MANMAQAIRMALHYAEENLGVMDIFGEDVGPPLGGVFTVTQGLKNAWNAPLAATLDDEASSQSRAFVTEDLREGAAAFVQKRPARFTGR